MGPGSLGQKLQTLGVKVKTLTEIIRIIMILES